MWRGSVKISFQWRFEDIFDYFYEVIPEILTTLGFSTFDLFLTILTFKTKALISKNDVNK